MKHLTIAAALIAATTVFSAAVSGAAYAQNVTTEQFGPNGRTITHSVRRGRVSMTSSYHTGPFGRHGCRTNTRTVRTGHGVIRRVVRRCH